MHSGNIVYGLGRIMHLPLARALSRPRPLTILPYSLCTKTLYLTLRGRITRAGSHCIRATATGVMYFPLMFDTCPGPGHVYPFDV